MKTSWCGFTLLEMLLVIVLIGLASSVIISMLPQNSRSLHKESNNLLDTLQFAQEQAILEDRVYGISIRPHSWQIIELVQSKDDAGPTWDSHGVSSFHWQVVRNKGKNLARKLPEQIQLQLSIEGIKLPMLACNHPDDNGPIPDLLFLPGGEVTPFQLVLTDVNSGETQAIGTNDQGALQYMLDSV